MICPRLKLVALGMGTLLSVTAVAGPTCTQESKDKWMTEEAMRAKIDAEGYRIKVFKTSGSCYEIYGHDKAGKKVEIYFNPVDGSIVKQRND
jgi:hypothetical protein